MNEFAVTGPIDSLRESRGDAQVVVVFTDMYGGIATKSVGPLNGVLITYTELRETGTGDTLAVFDPAQDRWLYDGVEYTDAEVLPYTA